MAGYWWLSGLALVAAAGWTTSASIALGRMRDERRRQRRADRQSQAERVSVWPGPRADPQPVTLLNHSEEPVYEAVATFVFIEGAGPRRGEEVPPELPGQRVTIGVLPPGRWRVCFPGGWDGTYPRLGVEVAFTDRAGVHWVRRARGQLEQLPRSAFDHFKLPRPVHPVPPQPDKASGNRAGHRGRVGSFSLGDGLGRRWSARCSCGWIATTATQRQACGEFARHHRERHEPGRRLRWTAAEQTTRRG